MFDQTRSFQDGLKELGGWSEEDTASVLREYRRFLYLKAVTGQPLTPPRAVDLAWHLHIEQVSDWLAFQVATGRSVPHQTGLIWPANRETYLRAHGAYRQEFDETPPVPIWPDPGQLGHLLRERRLAGWMLALSPVLWLIAALLEGGWRAGLILVGCVLAFIAISMFKSSGLGPKEVSDCG